MNTTDPQNEIFDVVDEDDNVIGKTTRSEANKNKNLIHRSIGVAVFNKKGEMFLQQRSATKDTDPGKWTISCSGHVNSGDSYENTAKREMEEELGLVLYKGTPCSTTRGPLEKPLEKVEKYICRTHNETEMTMLFTAVSEGPFTLHPQEIAQGKFFTRKELKEQVENGEVKLSFMGRVALQKLGWL